MHLCIHKNLCRNTLQCRCRWICMYICTIIYTYCSTINHIHFYIVQCMKVLHLRMYMDTKNIRTKETQFIYWRGAGYLPQKDDAFPATCLSEVWLEVWLHGNWYPKRVSSHVAVSALKPLNGKRPVSCGGRVLHANTTTPTGCGGPKEFKGRRKSQIASPLWLPTQSLGSRVVLTIAIILVWYDHAYTGDDTGYTVIYIN